MFFSLLYSIQEIEVLLPSKILRANSGFLKSQILKLMSWPPVAINLSFRNFTEKLKS